MITVYQHLNGEIRKLSLKELGQAMLDKQGILWVDMEDPMEAEEETLLVAMCDFHPIAIEDCQRGKEEEGHLPKVEDYGDYLFVIFNPAEGVPSAESSETTHLLEIRTSQLSAFLTSRLLVTHHYKPLRSINYAAQLCAKNPQYLGRGPDFLFHMIIDDVVDNYTPIMDNLDNALDQTEEEVFHQPEQSTMMRILMLKRNIMTVRRVALYQREMLNRLSRGEFPLITQDEMFYYRNVYDHLVRMTDLTDSYRDMVSSLLDAYLSVTSNKLNQVMKVLTIISTIFLPLSVITGFFGMNFVHLPLSSWEHGVLFTALGMLVVAVGMLILFKKNHWI
jgi:magnesium transporter